MTNEFRIMVLDCLERDEPYVLWRVEAAEGQKDTLKCIARFADGLTHAMRFRVDGDSPETAAEHLRIGLMNWHIGKRAHAS